MKTFFGALQIDGEISSFYGILTYLQWSWLLIYKNSSRSKWINIRYLCRCKLNVMWNKMERVRSFYKAKLLLSAVQLSPQPIRFQAWLNYLCHQVCCEHVLRNCVRSTSNWFHRETWKCYSQITIYKEQKIGGNKNKDRVCLFSKQTNRCVQRKHFISATIIVIKVSFLVIVLYFTWCRGIALDFFVYTCSANLFLYELRRFMLLAADNRFRLTRDIRRMLLKVRL